jgi:hypothetical protein
MEVSDFIEENRKRKIELKIFPTHTTGRELVDAGFNEDEINESVRMGVKKGRTINGDYYKIG